MGMLNANEFTGPPPPTYAVSICAAATMELRVGRKYRLGRKIGSGSFGGEWCDVGQPCKHYSLLQF